MDRHGNRALSESTRMPASLPTLTPERERGVIQAVLSGDTARFEELMRHCNRSLYRVVRSIVGQESDAEAVLQQAYLQAFESLSRFQGRSRFSTCVMRIAIREARRQAGASGALSPEPAERCDAEASPATRLAADEARDCIESAIAALPEAQRLAFTLRAVEGLSVAETAAALGVPRVWVRVSHHRARATLKQSLVRLENWNVEVEPYPFGGADCDALVWTVLHRISNTLVTATAHPNRKSDT